MKNHRATAMTMLPLWLRDLLLMLAALLRSALYWTALAFLVGFLVVSIKKLFVAATAAWTLWPAFRPLEIAATFYAGWHLYHDAHGLLDRVPVGSLPTGAWPNAGVTVFDPALRRPVTHL